MSISIDPLSLVLGALLGGLLVAFAAMRRSQTAGRRIAALEAQIEATGTTDQALDTLGASLDRRLGDVAGVHEALRRLEARAGELERARTTETGGLREQIESLLRQTEQLRSVAGSLDGALRGSQTRGRWGELTLRNAVELAGLSEHCDFLEQATVGVF